MYLRKVDARAWRAIVRQAYRYPASSEHPWCLAVEDSEAPSRIEYQGRDGVGAGFFHASITYKKSDQTVEFRQGDDPRAMSVLKAWKLLQPLLIGGFSPAAVSTEEAPRW